MMTNQEIDALLAKYRPDRYEAGDLAWAEPVIAEIGDEMTVSEAKHVAGEELVKRRERGATRKPNRMIRLFGETGQRPLDWMDMARQPVAVGEHRVCLDEMNAEDFREFANAERDAADIDYAARLDTVKGAEQLADAIDGAGVHNLGELWTDDEAAA